MIKWFLVSAYQSLIVIGRLILNLSIILLLFISLIGSRNGRSDELFPIWDTFLQSFSFTEVNSFKDRKFGLILMHVFLYDFETYTYIILKINKIWIYNERIFAEFKEINHKNFKLFLKTLTNILFCSFSSAHLWIVL